MRTKLSLALLAFTFLGTGDTAVHACFMRSPQPVQVWLDHIHVDITDQVAEKTYNCVFKNPNSQAVVGGTCYMELEPGAQVDNMVVVVDGKEARAEILDLEKANQVFTEMVKEGGNPALLEYYGNQLIQTQVPRIDPNGTVTVKLKYTTVLKSRGGLVRLQMLNTNPKALMQPLQSAGVTINIRSETPIKTVYSPTHDIKFSETENWDVTVNWSEENYLPKYPFVLYYQTAEQEVGASLLAHREPGEDGAFMLMLSPTQGQGVGKVTEEQILPKDIVFCVDTSGSMLENGKMEQARAALKYCVEHLRPGDRFNIVDFSTTVRVFSQAGLVEFNEETKVRALNYIEKLSARGGTAIQESLQTSLDQFSGSERLKMIVFATDGLPTIGEREPEKILKDVAQRNLKDVRIFAFGEGFNVNTKLLDFLALNHRGEAEYILPEEKIEDKISAFFDRIGDPLMTDLKVEFDGIEVTDVYPIRINDIYRGEQVILYGRYNGFGEKTVTVSGNVNGERKVMTFTLDFPEISEDDRNAFVPRLWAGQKVDDLLNRIRESEEEDMELIKEVTFLAKRYGILTPFTSFLMVDDNCIQPQTAQVANFTYRMRDEQSGLRGNNYGWMAVQNSQQQSLNRRALSTNGATTNMYAQVQSALEQEGIQQTQAMSTVRFVGNRCFYNSNNTWYDSQYDVTQQNKLQQVIVGSPEYLELLKNNPWAAKYLAQGNAVVELNGQWYQFEEPNRS